MKAKNLQLSFAYNKEPTLTIQLIGNTDHLQELAQVELLDIEIKPYREKRSLTANSYFWQIVTKIADTLRTSKDDLYIEMLKRYGQREKDLISVVSSAVHVAIKALDNHCTIVGESELKGKTFKHLAILKGSSEYDSKEMSILIDGVVSEAKELGIETLPHDEINRLLERMNRQ